VGLGAGGARRVGAGPAEWLRGRREAPAAAHVRVRAAERGGAGSVAVRWCLGMRRHHNARPLPRRRHTPAGWRATPWWMGYSPPREPPGLDGPGVPPIGHNRTISPKQNALAARHDARPRGRGARAGPGGPRQRGDGGHGLLLPQQPYGGASARRGPGGRPAASAAAARATGRLSPRGRPRTATARRCGAAPHRAAALGAGGGAAPRRPRARGATRPRRRPRRPRRRCCWRAPARGAPSPGPKPARAPAPTPSPHPPPRTAASRSPTSSILSTTPRRRTTRTTPSGAGTSQSRVSVQGMAAEGVGGGGPWGGGGGGGGGEGGGEVEGGGVHHPKAPYNTYTAKWGWCVSTPGE
jgi:hypothetical protein